MTSRAEENGHILSAYFEMLFFADASRESHAECAFYSLLSIFQYAAICVR